MKKIFSIVCMAAFVLLAVSCLKEGSQLPEKYQPATPLSYEGPGAVEFTSEGGSSHLVIDSSSPVEASSSAAWLAVEVSGRNVYLTAPANETLIARYSTLTLVSGGKSRDVQVKQYGVTSDYLWEAEYEFAYTGGELHLKNHPTAATVRVQVEGKDWISVVLGSESLDVTVAKNPDGEAREGSITWSAGEDVRVLAIKQAANPNPGGGGGGGGGDEPGGDGNVLFSEDFEDVAALGEWSLLDVDGDSYCWDYANNIASHSGSGILCSASYVNNVGALTPDNWVLTPAISLETDNYISFWVAAQDPDWDGEHYGVYVSTALPETYADLDNFQELYAATNPVANPYEEEIIPFSTEEGPVDITWQRIAVKIPSDFDNKDVYIGIRHFDCTDMFILDLDDVMVTKGLPAKTNASSVSSVKPARYIPFMDHKIR